MKLAYAISLKSTLYVTLILVVAATPRFLMIIYALGDADDTTTYERFALNV